MEIYSVADIAIGEAAYCINEQAVVVEGIADAPVGRSEFADRGRQIIQRERRAVSDEASEIIFALHANDERPHQLIIEADVSAAKSPRAIVAVGEIIKRRRG